MVSWVFSGGQHSDVENGKLDLSKKVELQFWMLGNAPGDLKLIEEEVNKLALEDLNCTVKFNYTTWTDWSQKYKLLLTSGQQIDLIFTSEWTDYQRYARSGAFLELENIVPIAAPELNTFIPENYWNAVKVAGHIYTMPNTWKEYVYDGFEYREDLRKKYKLPEINSIETIEMYLEAIAENEPSMMPLGEGGTGPKGFLMVYPITAELLHPWSDRSMDNYGLVSDNANPRVMYQYWGSEEHLNDLKRWKKWADNGYWSRSILSSTEDPVAAFQAGKLGAKISGINPVKYSQDVIVMGKNHPDWEVGYYPFSYATRIVHPVHPTHNGFAVPVSSKYPGRAVALFEKLVMDKKYNRLTNYGIEGVHYTNDNGYYKMLGNAETSGFKRESMNSWAWRNPEYMLFDPSFDLVKSIFTEFDKFSTPDLYNGFAEDYTPYQSQKTALEQVIAEYLAPLQAGLVEDVEAGLNKFMVEAKAAGMEEIQSEYLNQWYAYCDEMNIQ